MTVINLPPRPTSWQSSSDSFTVQSGWVHDNVPISMSHLSRHHLYLMSCPFVNHYTSNIREVWNRLFAMLTPRGHLSHSWEKLHERKTVDSLDRTLHTGCWLRTLSVEVVRTGRFWAPLACLQPVRCGCEVLVPIISSMHYNTDWCHLSW